MIAKARLTFDQPYYELMYSESLRHRSYYRRVAVPVSIAIIVSGIAMMMFAAVRPFGAVVLLIGLVDLLEATTHRRRWMKKVVDLKRGSGAEVQFMDSEIFVNSENARGSIRYEGFQTVAATPNGMFLVPQNGVSIFIPLATVDPQDAIESLVAHLLTKVKNQIG